MLFLTSVRVAVMMPVTVAYCCPPWEFGREAVVRDNLGKQFNASSIFIKIIFNMISSYWCSNCEVVIMQYYDNGMG